MSFDNQQTEAYNMLLSSESLNDQLMAQLSPLDRSLKYLMRCKKTITQISELAQNYIYFKAKAYTTLSDDKPVGFLIDYDKFFHDEFEYKFCSPLQK